MLAAEPQLGDSELTHSEVLRTAGELFTDRPVVTWNRLGPQLVHHRMKIACGVDV